MVEKEQRKEASTSVKTSFQEAWTTTLGSLKAARGTSAHHGGICLARDGTAILLDHRGKALWTAELGSDVRNVSIAETQEVLAVQESGSAMLIDPIGQILWKKRVFPAQVGAISRSGQFLAFITREPTVVLADRSSRPKWIYRNLLKIPSAICLAHEGEIVAFAVQDERGEGIIAISPNGKPGAAFMGLDPIVDIAISHYGQLIFALDKTGGVFCFNAQTGAGVWKTRLSSDFIGISHAEETGQTLLFAKAGGLCLLDKDGRPQWESRPANTLLAAGISSDGKSIWVATPEGLVLGLESQANRDMTRKGFADVLPPPPAPATVIFRRHWQCELPRPEPGDSPQCRIWGGPDSVEYLLFWDAHGCLCCLNDLGEEVWNIRPGGGSLRAMALSAAADLVLLATGQGVLGLRLDGTEEFRSIDTFKAAHVFGSGSFLQLDDSGKVSFFNNANHAAHPLVFPEAILRLAGTDTQAALVGEKSLYLVSSEGKIEKNLPGVELGRFFELLPSPPSLITGNSSGEMVFYDWSGEEVYRYAQPDLGPSWVAFHPEQDAVFIGLGGSPDVVILQNRLQNRITVSVSGQTRFGIPQSQGVVIGTTLDEIILIGCDGTMFGRYPFPDRLLGVFPANTEGYFYILSEGSIGKYSFAPVAGGISASAVDNDL